MVMHPSTYEYLKPTDEQLQAMQRVRAAAKAYGDALEKELPEGPDKTFVIRGHRSNAMWANVALTRLPDGTPRQASPETALAPGAAPEQEATAETQKKRDDEPRDEEPDDDAEEPDDPQAFQPGSMVALNNPNPPLRIEVSGRHHGNLAQGEIGQVARMGEDGMAVVVWRSLPSLQVMVPADWLVAAIETDGGEERPRAETTTAQDASDGEDDDEIFAQPYAKQTTSDYSEYAKRWLARAAAKGTLADDVQTRWEKERNIRNDLASPFQLDEWQALRKVFADTMAQLGGT